MFEFLRGVFGERSRQTEKGIGRWLVSPEVQASVHADGAVFLHTGRSVLFSCNRVGAGIWQGVVNGETPRDIAAGISRDYGVAADEVERDTLAFLTQMEAQGILKRARG